ncbi:hypothetical protein BHE74_00055443 [Ensete ventricosum]|nr:hypothetical protein BHE74_00055443 [Ensete ventricosum]
MAYEGSEEESSSSLMLAIRWCIKATKKVLGNLNRPDTELVVSHSHLPVGSRPYGRRLYGCRPSASWPRTSSTLRVGCWQRVVLLPTGGIPAGVAPAAGRARGQLLPLRVMRLNRVESFYAFLLHFYSEGNEEEGRPAPCRAGHPQPGQLQGSAGYSQGPLQGGDRPRPKPLAWPTTNRRGSPRAWLAPTGVGNTRGQVAGDGCPLQGRKGQPHDQGCRLRGRPLEGATASRGSARAARRWRRR